MTILTRAVSCTTQNHFVWGKGPDFLLYPLMADIWHWIPTFAQTPLSWLSGVLATPAQARLPPQPGSQQGQALLNSHSQRSTVWIHSAARGWRQVMSPDSCGIFRLLHAQVEILNYCRTFFLCFRDVSILQLTVKFLCPFTDEWCILIVAGDQHSALSKRNPYKTKSSSD